MTHSSPYRNAYFGRMKKENGVQYWSRPEAYRALEAQYLAVREKEGWLFDDATLRRLPRLPEGHPQHKTGLWRRRSLARLLARLRQKGAIQLLDAGCGNGWMSHQLASQLDATVWATDVNRSELEQGARVFVHPRLQFLFVDIQEDTLPAGQFDVVLFAGSFQYFSDAKAALSSARRLLAPQGEIHLIDTNFYPDENSRRQARAATAQYYARLDLPGMTAYYHHHLLSEVGGENLNARLWPRFLQKIKWLSPFPWIRLMK